MADGAAPSTDPAVIATTIAQLRSENKSLLDRLVAAELQNQNQLGLTLNEVSKTNRSIQTSLGTHDERVLALHSQIKDLHSKPGVEADAATVASTSSAHDNTKENDIQSLRHELAESRRASDRLRIDLESEQTLTNALRTENNSLKRLMVDLQASAEMEEEFISNTLLKRIHELQREKGELLIRVEAEEEMITNQLQKKLQQLQKDKIGIEVALEREQEFMVNRLQKQLDDLRGRLGNGLSVSTGSKKWPYPHSNSSSMSELTSPTIAPGVVEVLKAEVNASKLKLQETEKSIDDWTHRANTQYQQLRQFTVSLMNETVSEPQHTQPTSIDTAIPSPVCLNPVLNRFDGEFPATLPDYKTMMETVSSTTSTSTTLSTVPITGVSRVLLTSRGSIPHRSPSVSPILGRSIDQQSHRTSRSLGRSSFMN